LANPEIGSIRKVFNPSKVFKKRGFSRENGGTNDRKSRKLYNDVQTGVNAGDPDPHGRVAAPVGDH
jgi:hypothetical protein